jgi:glucose/arabinose dehydrogenase
VLEQAGAVRIIKNGSLLQQPFMDLDVDSNGERGLLGIAFDPDFAANSYVYVYYTVPGGGGNAPHNRVSRFTANQDAVVAGSEQVIIDLDDLSGATNHNGGAIHFGPEAQPKLYIAVGDNANGTNAQSLSTTHGKMLRINKDGTIPTDNPFYNQTSGKDRAIWTLGLRNPFTFAFQPGTGRMFINDVGQNTYEEINDGIAGSNYGWPSVEGNSGTPPSGPGTYRAPIHVYSHGSGNNQGYAVTGGAFYNPATSNFPSPYVGDYFFADYVNGWIRKLDLPDTGGSGFATGIDAPVDLKLAADGSLWYLLRGGGSNDGEVWRITYNDNSAPSITQHPQSQTRSVGQSVTFNVSATGQAPLSFQWQRDAVDIPGATASSYTINSVAMTDNGAVFRCVVSNSLGTATSNSATLTVQENQAPTATITSPAAGKTYSGGERIFFTGTGTDFEDGTLAGSQFTWDVVFHHDTHTHGGPGFTLNLDGKGGFFDIPTVGHTEANVFYRIHLTVRDSQNATHSVFRDVTPKTSQITLTTNPPGLQLTLDAQPFVSGNSFTGVVGIQRAIGTPTSQVKDGVMYEFDHWSDGGAATHDISTPASDTTYTAFFRNTGNGTGLAATYYDNKNFTGPTVQRIDATINFDWLSGSPDASIGTNTFSARWNGQVQAQFSEPYVFNTKTDDGVRLWIDGQLVIDNWNGGGLRGNKTVPINLVAGQKYAITMDYYEAQGEASAKLMWSSPSTVKTIVPTSQLYGSLNPVPGPWQQTDVGTVPIAGSATFSDGLFTVSGAGRRIGKNADAFHFVYQSLNGDGEIIARIASVLETDNQARAGVMIRGSLDANARFALMGLNASGTALFQSRTSAGANTSNQPGITGLASLWVRLVRAGNRITGFRSTDGVSWIEVGFTDIAMGSNVFVGLAVSAHSDTQLNTSLLDNVAVS